MTSHYNPRVNWTPESERLLRGYRRDGLNYHQIADLMGIAESAARRRGQKLKLPKAPPRERDAIPVPAKPRGMTKEQRQFADAHWQTDPQAALLKRMFEVMA